MAKHCKKQATILKKGLIKMANLINQERQEIKNLLIQLNSLLTKHIEVHDSIFNPPLRSRIPIPFIMKKIDVKKQFEMAQDIQVSIGECLEKAHLIKSRGKMDSATFQIIFEYGQLFLESVISLSVLAYELSLKAEGTNNLSFKEFNTMVDQYNENEQTRIGYSNRINLLAKEYLL